MNYARILVPLGLAVGFAGQMHAQAVAFTTAQAAQGKTAYTQNCESCHGANLDDGQFGPPLKGSAFNRQWGGKPADAAALGYLSPDEFEKRAALSATAEIPPAPRMSFSRHEEIYPSDVRP
jgi:mono/diheme cytochrome c family protein